MGRGDYKIKSNSLMGQVPKFGNSNGTIRVRHREFLGDISGSILFNKQTFAVNPGLSNTFPWLSVAAAQYQEYEIKGMILEFVSTCGNAISSTNNSLGTVVISTQYNPLDPAYINKIQMENSEFCTSGKPSSNLMHGLECKRGLSPISNLYTRTLSTDLGNSDLRLYDFCNISIATVGMQEAVTIGEIWLSYDMCLLKPKTITGLTGASTVYTLNSASTTNSLGTSRTGTDTLGITFPTNNTIVFPQTMVGKFSIALAYVGDNTNLMAAPSMVGSAGANPLSVNAATFVSSPNVISTTTIVQAVYYFTITNGGTVVTTLLRAQPNLTVASLVITLLN
jgi:hypothetical protein